MGPGRADAKRAIPRNDFPEGLPHHFFMDRFTDAFRAELAAFVDVVKGNAVPGVHGGRRGRGRLAGRSGHRVVAARRPVRIEEVKSR